MSHLTIDRIAAIADDTPTADEATHLAGCWDCRAELAAFRRLVRMSAMAPLPQEPLTAWSRLAPQLRAEGILIDAARATPAATTPAVATPRWTVDTVTPQPLMHTERRRGRVAASWMLRAAAGVALLLGGIAIGRGSTGVPFALGTGAGATSAAATAPAFVSSDEAIAALAAAQQQYQSAAAFLAGQDTSAHLIGMDQDSYQTRLTALDEIAAAARAALFRAPQDPMLNQYYLTTLGAREATLRQIGATMPTTSRLGRY